MLERIFLSSVQKELQAERRAIRDFVHADALLSRYFEVFLFESLPASGRRADQVYLEEVERCPLYVGLFGNEYGSEDHAGLSPTEREFDHATAKGNERLIWVKGYDDSARHPKMQALVRKASDQVVRRRFSGTTELTASLYESLVSRLMGNGTISNAPFDTRACLNAELADISRRKVNAFLALAREHRDHRLDSKMPWPDVLAHLKFLNCGKPNHAAVLLFGKDPQHFLISSEVKCMRFYGLEVHKPIPAYSIYKGTAFEMADQATDFVMAKIDRAIELPYGEMRSRAVFELPPPALREAIINGITHRDYSSTASVQVMLFADRFEVWSPGQLAPELTLEKLRQPHGSYPRNGLVAEAMFLAGYAEKAGSGILDMIKLCKAAGLRPPDFRNDGGMFVQTLWRPEFHRFKGSTGEVTPYETPYETPYVTPHEAPQVTVEVAKLIPLCVRPAGREQLQLALSLKDAKHFRQAYLQPAIAQGYLEMTLPKKPKSRQQKYRLTRKGQLWLEDYGRIAMASR